MTHPALIWGLSLAALAGVLNGTFTLPMRFLGRWSWENMWALFILVSCIAMPIVAVLGTVSNPEEVLAAAPGRAVLMAAVTGFAWGFGAIMFGQGVSAMGISMGNTLVLAISSSLGSFLPLVILAPERLFRRQGEAIILGTVVALAGIVACGYAGLLREREQADQQGRVRGDMIGQAKPFAVGLLLCAGAGLLSAVFNIGYSSAQGIIGTAKSLGNNAFAGSNMVWLLMLTSGAVANVGFCGHLFKKNRTWSKYAQADSVRLYGLTILMGLLWGGSIFAYGSAAPKLGRLGSAIGWPLFLTISLLTANLCGLLAGEWKLTGATARGWMIVGLVILCAEISILGWSSKLA